MENFDEIAYCQKALDNCEKFTEETCQYDADTELRGKGPLGILEDAEGPCPSTVAYWENRLFIAMLERAGCEVIDDDRSPNRRRPIKTTGVRSRT